MHVNSLIRLINTSLHSDIFQVRTKHIFMKQINSIKRITHKGRFFSREWLSDGIRHLSSTLILGT